MAIYSTKLQGDPIYDDLKEQLVEFQENAMQIERSLIKKELVIDEN